MGFEFVKVVQISVYDVGEESEETSIEFYSLELFWWVRSYSSVVISVALHKQVHESP